MNAETTDLVLEQLRAIRVDLGDIKNVLGEHTRRFNRLEAALNTQRHDSANLHQEQSDVQMQINRIEEDLNRVKRRLELTDAPTS
ncbi:MAG: hypothetical protein V3U60_16370 [Gammaproteobacteria bacterium]